MLNDDWKNFGLPILLLAIAIGGFAAGALFAPTQKPTPAQLDRQARANLRAGHAQLALASFSQRAAKGDATAQYWLGDAYENGLGVRADGALAVKWLTAAAKAANVPAERQLGEIYLSGNLVVQDFTDARHWLTRAAMANDPQAQLHLGDMNVKGLGRAPDPVTAYAWYEQAALNGDGFAQIKRDKLLARLTPSQQAAGEAKAKVLNAALAAAPPAGSIPSPTAPTISKTANAQDRGTPPQNFG